MEVYKYITVDCVKHKHFLPYFLVRKFLVDGDFSQIFRCISQKYMETVPDHLGKISSTENSVKTSFQVVTVNNELAIHYAKQFVSCLSNIHMRWLKVVESETSLLLWSYLFQPISKVQFSHDRMLKKQDIVHNI